MKKEKTEELLVKAIDGELSAEDEEQLKVILEEDPVNEEELSALKEISAQLQASVPASETPPYPDFFNSQLMRKVDLEITSKRPSNQAGFWWESLRWAWAPVGALSLVLSFFAGHRLGHNPERSPSVADAGPKRMESIVLPTVYSAGNSLEAEVIANSEGEVTAIVVNGIAALKDDIDFSTVTTIADLPQTYRRSEALRFD